MAQPKLGTGARFAALKGQLAAKGAHDPGALSAWIGRKKYGAAKMGAMASHGTMTKGDWGDVGQRRGDESVKVGGFKSGRTVSSKQEFAEGVEPGNAE